MMSSGSNLLPKPGAEFPAAWADEFNNELVTSALRRAGIVTTTLLVIEGILLASDFYRTHGFKDGPDALFIWRIAALVFLLTYRFLVERFAPEIARLRYFLIFGMFLCCWASAVLAGIAGDMSTFTIGALGVAAACPLPGRFNSSLFAVSGAALIGWLFLHFPNAGLFWSSNIVATCLIGIVIEKFTFDAALREFSHRKGIERQRERADELLYNVFPQTVAASLKEGKRSVALHGEVTILFADVVGFTQLSSRLLPSQLLDLLEEIFGEFDSIAQKHGVEKIKTIGDAYMAISGAPLVVDHQVERMADFALEIVQVCQLISKKTGFELAVRVGIHTGPVVAGVIGSSRLCYDLWGDSVNIAQRIESHGEPNMISVSEPIYFKLRSQFLLADRGLIDLKGKGLTKTYVLKNRLTTP
jgi:class 3 adenylate cyclase